MKTWKELFVVGLMSFIFGGVIAAPIIAIENGEWLPNLFRSGVVGLLIGIAARYAFRYFYKNIKNKTLPSFLAVLLLIGLGTFLGAYLLGVRRVSYFLIMILPAEFIGFLVTLSMYLYNMKLNKGLEDTQKKYK